MAVLNFTNTAAKPANMQVPLASDCANMRNEFHDWLVDDNAKKYSPEVIDCYVTTRDGQDTIHGLVSQSG